MRVIALQEQWASPIAANIKKIEMRSLPCFEHGDFYFTKAIKDKAVRTT